MERLAVIVVLSLAACATVEPLEPVGTTVGWTSGDDDASSGTGSDASTGPDTASSAADVTSETGPDAPRTSESDETGACPVGAEGCACTPDDACDPGLTCLSGFCVDAGERCPVGAEGCPCTIGGACDPGLQCASMICVDPG